MAQGGIRAGSLNRKIDLYKEVVTSDSSGQEIRGYQYDFSLLSDARPLRGTERAQAGRVELATITYTFRTYYKEKISVKHKVKFNGEFFDIQSLAPMGNLNRRFMEIFAELRGASTLVIV